MKHKIPSRELSLILSIAFTVFTLCGLQFYAISSIMHDSFQKRHNHEYETYSEKNLPGVLKTLEIKDDYHRLRNDTTPLPKTEDWKVAKDKLDSYEEYISNLKYEIGLYRESEREVRSQLSRIQLRNSVIGLILILSSVYFLYKSKKEADA